jgi:hypothetical protein
VKNWPRINQSLSQSGHMAMYANPSRVANKETCGAS